MIASDQHSRRTHDENRGSRSKSIPRTAVGEVALTAPTAALADIMRSKEAAGREKDVLLTLPVPERHLRAHRERGDS